VDAVLHHTLVICDHSARPSPRVRSLLQIAID
jgi:hypothetical protein